MAKFKECIKYDWEIRLVSIEIQNKFWEIRSVSIEINILEKEKKRRKKGKRKEKKKEKRKEKLEKTMEWDDAKKKSKTQVVINCF